MRHFFTARQLSFMGSAAPKAPPRYTGELPNCCELVKEEERCPCGARSWRCPKHGRLVEPCRSGNSHD